MLAWQVLKAGRNKSYYRMYRHSNYYLLLLFVVLAADVVGQLPNLIHDRQGV